MYIRKKQKTHTGAISLIEILGWVGLILGMSAYTLIVFRVVSADNYWYLWLNIIGSALLVVEARRKDDWPSVVGNCIVGGFAMINFLRLFLGY